MRFALYEFLIRALLDQSSVHLTEGKKEENNTEDREILLAWQKTTDMDSLRQGLDLSLQEHLNALMSKATPPLQGEAQQRALRQCINRVRERWLKELKAKEQILISELENADKATDLQEIQKPAVKLNAELGEVFLHGKESGMSAAPLYERALERREDDLRELAILERWHTVHEYRMLISKRGIALNSAMLAGHGNIRGSVVGYENREHSGQELSEMKRLLEEALREGCIGLSTGLISPPGIYSSTEELTELGRVLKRYDLPYASHMRSEGTSLLESIKEVIAIGDGARIRVHISHIKTAGSQNWYKADAAISMIEDARQRGIQVTCDRYPYVASSIDLDSILPSWAFEGGNNKELQRISQKETRSRLRTELLTQAGDSDYWERVIVSSVISDKNRWMEGKTIAQISAKEKDTRPYILSGAVIPRISSPSLRTIRMASQSRSRAPLKTESSVTMRYLL